MLKDTSMRHCQHLEEGMGNTEVRNFCERKDELTKETVVRVTFKITQRKKV